MDNIAKEAISEEYERSPRPVPTEHGRPHMGKDTGRTVQPNVRPHRLGNNDQALGPDRVESSIEPAESNDHLFGKHMNIER
ncbi:hypothetical protein FRC12_019781 [Ceratobasidium sp. 428]|nr:hypothetical protein FRC12_019781 [Ceratobasidium sp. 428]